MTTTPEAVILPTLVATFFEYREGTESNQFIIFSEAIDPDTGEKIPLTMFNRLVSKDRPKAGWRYKQSEPSKSVKLTTRGTIPTAGGLSNALEYAAKITEYINDYLTVPASNEWDFYKVPVTVEVGPAEVSMLRGKVGADKKTTIEVPPATWARIKRARLSAGFSAEMWNEKL